MQSKKNTKTIIKNQDTSSKNTKLNNKNTHPPKMINKAHEVINRFGEFKKIVDQKRKQMFKIEHLIIKLQGIRNTLNGEVETKKNKINELNTELDSVKKGLIEGKTTLLKVSEEIKSKLETQLTIKNRLDKEEADLIEKQKIVDEKLKKLETLTSNLKQQKSIEEQRAQLEIEANRLHAAFEELHKQKINLDKESQENKQKAEFITTKINELKELTLKLTDKERKFNIERQDFLKFVEKYKSVKDIKQHEELIVQKNMLLNTKEEVLKQKNTEIETAKKNIQKEKDLVQKQIQKEKDLIQKQIQLIDREKNEISKKSIKIQQKENEFKNILTNQKEKIAEEIKKTAQEKELLYKKYLLQHLKDIKKKAEAHELLIIRKEKETEKKLAEFEKTAKLKELFYKKELLKHLQTMQKTITTQEAALQNRYLQLKTQTEKELADLNTQKENTAKQIEIQAQEFEIKQQEMTAKIEELEKAELEIEQTRQELIQKTNAVEQAKTMLLEIGKKIQDKLPQFKAEYEAKLEEWKTYQEPIEQQTSFITKAKDLINKILPKLKDDFVKFDEYQTELRNTSNKIVRDNNKLKKEENIIVNQIDKLEEEEARITLREKEIAEKEAKLLKDIELAKEGRRLKDEIPYLKSSYTTWKSALENERVMFEKLATELTSKQEYLKEYELNLTKKEGSLNQREKILNEVERRLNVVKAQVIEDEGKLERGEVQALMQGELETLKQKAERIVTDPDKQKYAEVYDLIDQAKDLINQKKLTEAEDVVSQISQIQRKMGEEEQKRKLNYAVLGLKTDIKLATLE